MTRRPEDLWLALTPRDTVFIRDGRSFDAASDVIAQTVRPGPSTIAGAAFRAFGGSSPEPDAVRGPVLARAVGDEGDWEPYFPMPADVVGTADDEVSYAFRLTPVESDAETDLGTRVRRWLVSPHEAGKVEPLSGWLPGRRLAEYLAGGLPAPGGTEVEELELVDPLVPELRVGLARDPDRRVKSGHLYQVTHLRPDERGGQRWSFLAGCVLPSGWDRTASGPVPLGGRGRLADVAAVSGITWPDMPEEFEDGRVLVYLASPAIWPDGWRLPLPEGVTLEAAATGDPGPVATTSPRQGWKRHRMLRWAVPAGSVYLLKFGDAAAAYSWAKEHHGTAYGPVADERLRTAGFGVVLTGVWT